MMSKIYTSADQLIGATPLLELSHIEREHRLKARILAKLEYFNPAGSVKDRIAKAQFRHYRTHLRQHRHRPCLCGSRAGLPNHHRHA